MRHNCFIQYLAESKQKFNLKESGDFQLFKDVQTQKVETNPTPDKAERESEITVRPNHHHLRWILLSQHFQPNM